ncbi:sodium-dependent transporter [Massilibacterium senegalense]|uniref:sodium-dependent transporter n=1 Tax=Massilibacterium senegalense TaxID=1632858 RepID=UPI0007857654|nr:sodium-dependent transporter [Massilibacterium senegalense]
MQPEQWTSKLGFILAAAGSAIGIGAIWKFPYMTGMNGGGIFLLLFIIFTLLIGGPLLLSEFVIGRHTQKEAISAYQSISPKWAFIGYLGVGASFLLLSFYSVVGGWILLYLLKALTGTLSNLSNAQYEEVFNQMITNPTEVLIAQFIFMLFTIIVVQGGIEKGIEKASRIMMPALFILFIVLVIRSITLDGAMEGIRFLLQPDFSMLTPKTLLLAMGQAFFSLSVGVSVMVTYSSYLAKNESLVKSTNSVIFLNIFISLLAGLAIFPAVFAFGFEPTAGPGLIFIVLPAVFNQMAFGQLFFIIFLVLLVFATLTSAFSMLEIIVASVSRKYPNKRRKLTFISGILIFIVGIPSALAFGVLQDMTIFGKNIFDAADFLVSTILLPLGALFISIFTGYIMPKSLSEQEIAIASPLGAKIYPLWRFIVRYIAPIAITIIFLQSLGLIK